MGTKRLTAKILIFVAIMCAALITGVAVNAKDNLAYAESDRAVTNGWIQTPNIMRWCYGEYNPSVNLIVAEAEHNTPVFCVTTDAQGELPVNDVLKNFTAQNGIVSTSVAAELAKLNAGEYYLCAKVEGTDEYGGLNPAPMKFVISQGDNVWITSPEIVSWEEGKFNEKDNALKAVAKFGNENMRVVIYRSGDKSDVIYDSLKAIDNRAKAKAGSYEITVSVDGTSNYKALSKTFTFNVFKKAGMPWWSAVMTAFAALGLTFLALALLHQKGVIQILSGKIYIAMRNRATIDATIAAVRANKIAKEAKRNDEEESDAK